MTAADIMDDAIRFFVGSCTAVEGGHVQGTYWAGCREDRLGQGNLVNPMRKIRDRCNVLRTGISVENGGIAISPASQEAPAADRHVVAGEPAQ